jgi:hypothetical protein
LSATPAIAASAAIASSPTVTRTERDVLDRWSVVAELNDESHRRAATLARRAAFTAAAAASATTAATAEAIGELTFKVDELHLRAAARAAAAAAAPRGAFATAGGFEGSPHSAIKAAKGIVATVAAAARVSVAAADSGLRPDELRGHREIGETTADAAAGAIEAADGSARILSAAAAGARRGALTSLTCRLLVGKRGAWRRASSASAHVHAIARVHATSAALDAVGGIANALIRGILYCAAWQLAFGCGARGLIASFAAHAPEPGRGLAGEDL